jgi:hypothetical protein
MPAIPPRRSWSKTLPLPGSIYACAPGAKMLLRINTPQVILSISHFRIIHTPPTFNIEDEVRVKEHAFSGKEQVQSLTTLPHYNTTRPTNIYSWERIHDDYTHKGPS